MLRIRLVLMLLLFFVAVEKKGVLGEELSSLLPQALKKQAAQGDARAQSNLGFIYMTGRGVPQNYKEGLKWSRLAAAQGDAYAQNALGTRYVTGHVRMPHDPSLPMVVLQLRRTQVIEDYKQVN